MCIDYDILVFRLAGGLVSAKLAFGNKFVRTKPKRSRVLAKDDWLLLMMGTQRSNGHAAFWSIATACKMQRLLSAAIVNSRHRVDRRISGQVNTRTVQKSHDAGA